MFSWLFGKKKLAFHDVFASKSGRYSLGIERSRKTYYLSIPVSNQFVAYEEYYEIDKRMFEAFQLNPDSALEFADKCRKREMDHLLIVKPGRDRGSPS